jgi:hypothetical protein
MCIILVSDSATKFFEKILGGGIAAIAFYPFIIAPTTTVIDKELINHERIHLRQQLEMLIIPFYIYYLFLLKRKGYLNISFEKEAYANEGNLNYLKERKPYAWLKYNEKQI